MQPFPFFLNFAFCFWSDVSKQKVRLAKYTCFTVVLSQQEDDGKITVPNTHTEDCAVNKKP